MRLFSSTRSILPLLVALALAAPARGESVRLIRADDRGVTLGLEVGAFHLEGAEGGRLELIGTGLPILDLPGRPRLPNGYALIAIPPGATATASLVGGAAEEVREPVRLAIGERPSFRNDFGGLGLVPTREPAAAILDGPWPPAPVELSAPFTVRRQTMVAIQLRPFRYDEAGQRLWTRRSLIVRVDFAGAGVVTSAPVAEDRHWEPVLKSAVLNYEQGRRWRLAPQRTGSAGPGRGSLFAPPAGGEGVLQGAAFDEGETEVRVRIDTTGVYGLEYAKLAAAGFPAGVPIGQISVHRHEYTGTGYPPYATIELPVEVEDVATKGTFDAGDRILVYAQPWAERARASHAQRSWGDADYVYVTRLRTRAPLRVTLRSGWRGTSPPVLPSYPWSQHRELDLAYMTFPPDTNMDLFQWTPLMEYFNRPDTIRFETNQLDASRNVSISVSIQGRKQITHFTWIQVENGSGLFTSVADSVYWSGKTPRDFPATLPGTALSEGLTNRLKLWGKDFDAPPDPVANALSYAGLNAFDVTYWRSYHALAGMLPCNSGDAAGEFEILADGFATDSIRAWDVNDPANPVRLTDVVIAPAAAPFTLRLQDQVVGPARSYVIFTTPKLLPANHYGAVTPHQLYAQPGPFDYLLVTPPAFLPAANALAAQRASEGLQVLVATTDAVYDEFNGGRKSPYAIRRFVRYFYDNWDARFLLLMGDASEDPLNRGGQAGTDWIPAQLVLGPVGVFLADGYLREVVLSDNWFAWAIDTPPAPLAPLMPDLYVGRLPANDLTQATDMVNKLIAYDQVDTTQTWRRRILLHADDAWSGESTFGGGGSGSGYCFKTEETKFVSLSRAVRAVVADSAGLGLCEPEIFDMNVLLAPLRTDGSLCGDRDATIAYTRLNLTLRQLFFRLNDGRVWWNYQGHANATVLEHESIYWKGGFPNDVTQFKNYGKPFLFTAFSCHANAFGQPKEANFTVGTSIGEDMVTLPQAGAIASWASTGYEIIPSSDTDHLNVTLAQSLFSDPPRDDYLGHGASAVLGEGIGLALIRNWTARQSNPFERDVSSTYVLLGDPATRFSIGPPQITVTANHVPVTDGLPVILPGQSDTLRIDADFVSNAAIDSISLERTDEISTVILPASAYTISPPFPDTGPGSGGARRFHLVYDTQLSTGTYRYTLRSRDRYGVTAKFDVVFAFQTVLRDAGRPLRNGDAVLPAADLTLLVLSPNTLVPATDMALFIDGNPQTSTATPANGDLTGRQFVLTWLHAPYSPGTHVVRLDVRGSTAATHEFRVVASLRIADLLSFPNPFDDELGTRFTFDLLTDAPADLMIRVYTTSGRMVYERTERALQPGHHELPWDGRDAEGDKLANGVYLYRMVAKGTSGSASESGRLVKLRKPRQAPSETPP